MPDDIAVLQPNQHVQGIDPTDPVLATDEIQGDILIGLPKKAQVFVFFTITDKAAFKTAFAKSLLQQVTTTRQAQEQMEQIKAHKAYGKTDLLPIFGFNVGFTNHGIELLVGSTAGMDDSFVHGAKAQALKPQPISFIPGIGLNDPQDGHGNLSTWKPEYLAEEKIHGVMMFTGPAQDEVVKRANDALAALGAGAVTEVRREIGHVRPGLEDGHEHFGYLDGVSQPGVRGITQRTDPAGRPNEGLPGQELLWPGQFVFGYPTQVRQGQGQPPVSDEFAPGPVTPLPDNLKWMKDGSLMVFRRLNQRVPEFHALAASQATALGTDPTLLEARMVGRWKSGAPLEITPLQDDPELAKDVQANNDFVFSTDQFQRACPYAAHIRKANPRDDEADPANPAGKANAHAAVLIRRIMRAGIPFGPEVSRDEAVAGKTTAERGLLFVCYQTSINDQFEFVQTAWVNNPGFIFAKKRPTGEPVTPGFDPILGQASPTGDRKRTSDEPVPNFPTGNQRSTLTMPDDFIVPTGGAYVFVPSISALKNTLLH